MVDMRNYALKVRRSLLQRDLLGGVPTTGLVAIFIMSVMFVYVFRMYFMIAFIVVLYIIMRHLTAKDPWMIDIVLNNIQEKDIFIP